MALAEREDGFAVALDGKPVRTPGKRILVVPVRALARAVAAEWRDQADEIAPATMRLTRLANTALDHIAPRRAEAIDEIVRYGGTDLVCYRADGPSALVERQADAWQPLVDWVARRYGASLTVITGLIPEEQPQCALAALRDVVAAFDDFALTALHAVVACCGSLVIGLALFDGRIDAETAWRASQLDETYQIERWGEDSEAGERRAALRAEIAAAAQFLALCRDEAAT